MSLFAQETLPKFPDGFFKLESAAGAPLGMAFHCERCSLTVYGVAGPVAHCGRSDEYEPPGMLGGFLNRLPVVRLPYGRARTSRIMEV